MEVVTLWIGLEGTRCHGFIDLKLNGLEKRNGTPLNFWSAFQTLKDLKKGKYGVDEFCWGEEREALRAITTL